MITTTNKTARRVLVMAIVNCNNDSFFPQSRAADADTAVEKALLAVKDGADIIDIGGESTRPGAAYIDEEEEGRRVLPVIRGVRRQSTVPISVDTRKAAIADAALEAGANIINDISALEDDPNMGKVCAAHGAKVALMHKKGAPETMQKEPFYQDVVAEVAAYLQDAAQRALDAGVARENIILDPGIGFGKRLEDNTALIRRLATICALGYPVLAGLSRKTFIGELTGRGVAHRLAGSLAANAAAIIAGADIIRVHDVKESVDMVKVLNGVVAETLGNI
ncbi:MAG: dihydropteroate synthase [Treponema sp.]|jgi:dihydropteroate synthase|nr:dihydropteroate synthase [Treponema sp.]